jgi:hypothetical protein
MWMLWRSEKGVMRNRSIFIKDTLLWCSIQNFPFIVSSELQVRYLTCFIVDIVQFQVQLQIYT